MQQNSIVVRARNWNARIAIGKESNLALKRATETTKDKTIWN